MTIILHLQSHVPPLGWQDFAMGHVSSLRTIIIFLLCPIWLSICLAWSTQYISIAPLLPWQISGCWDLFPQCSFSCTDREPEKKPFQRLINGLCGSSTWTRFHPCAHSLIGHMLRSASWGFILFYLIEKFIHEYCVCIIPTPSSPLPFPLVSLYFIPIP